MDILIEAAIEAAGESSPQESTLSLQQERIEKIIRRKKQCPSRV